MRNLRGGYLSILAVGLVGLALPLASADPGRVHSVTAVSVSRGPGFLVSGLLAPGLLVPGLLVPGLLVRGLLVRGLLVPGSVAAGDESAPVDVADLDAEARRLAATLGPADDEERESILVRLSELEAALRKHETSAAGSDEARCHLALYRILCARGQHHPTLSTEERVSVLDEARDHAEASGSREAVARARLIKATMLRLDGRFADAWQVLEDVAAKVPEARNVMPFVLHAKADLERTLGRYADALETLDLCEEVRPEGPAWEPLRWRVAGVRGHIYLELGVFDVAARYIDIESGLCEPLRESYGTRFKKDLISMHLHGASLALGQGRFSRAVERVDRCLADVELFDGEDRWRSEMLLIKGVALAALERDRPGETETAESVLTDALEVPELAGRGRARCEMELAMLCLRRGDHSGAARRLEVAAIELERFRELRGRDDLLPEDADLATARARLAIEASEHPAVLMKRANELEAAIAVRLDLWAGTPLRRGGLGFLHPPSRRGWFSELARLFLLVHGSEEGAIKSVEQLMVAQAKGTLVRSQGGVAGDIEDVRERVLSHHRHGLLVYLPGPDRSHVFAIDRLSASGHEIPSHAELNSLVRWHRSYIARRASVPQVENGGSKARQLEKYRLNRALFPGGISLSLGLSWDQLTVVGADMFGSPSIALLPGVGPDRHEAMPVDELPSLALGLLLADRAERKTEADLLLVSTPVIHPSVHEQFAGLDELDLPGFDPKALAAPYGEGAYDAWSGEGASKDRVLSTDLSRYRVGQFLLHGVQNQTLERPSCLVFCGDDDDAGIVTCEDVEGASAPEFVILTACGAGIGPVRMGDDAVGHLGGAFLAAGANAVLLPNQDLSLGLALELSARLHPLLSAGASPAEALAQSRVAMLEDGVIESVWETAHLRLIGLGHRPPITTPRIVSQEPPSSTTSRWWWLGGFFAGAYALRLFRRFRAYRAGRPAARTGAVRRSGH